VNSPVNFPYLAVTFVSRLEERQRYERREREARGDEWTPRWFRPTGETACEGDLPIFEYTGAYTERVAAIKSGQLKDGINLMEEGKDLRMLSVPG
jgi:hypothetical protein